MREKEITFQGLNYTPYGDISPDGQLESCVGLEMHDGSLRPAVLDGTEYSLPSDYSGIILKCMHSTSEYSHFIFLSSDSKTLYWADVQEGSLSISEILAMETSVNSIKSIGNTLVVLSPVGMHYFLFKDGSYKYLGQKPPETVIQFTLVSERVYFKRDKVSLISHKDIVKDVYSDTLYTETGYMELKDEKTEFVTSEENALVSRLVSDANESGRIVYPVLVRYAYRLYDGSSYIMQSSPVLLVPNTDVAPAVIYRAGKDIVGSSVYTTANISSISYKFVNSELEDWKDVISSVDIFMTDQIYSRNIDSKITHVIRFSESMAGNSRNYGIFSDLVPHVGPKTLYQAWLEAGNTDEEGGYMYTFHGEKMKPYDFLSKISDASAFYKVKSITIENIQQDVYTYLFDAEEPTAVTLKNLTFQETLPDDWQSHDTLIPDTSFVYNRRLNIADYTRVLFGGYDTTSMMPLVQTEDSVLKHYTVYTHIRKGSRDIVVKNTCSGIQGFYPMYLFYPDTDAYKMTIVSGTDHDTSIKYYGRIFDLSPHPFLNGSYWFSSFVKDTPEPHLISVPEVTDSSVRYSNGIATSELENPFIFPLKGRNTVGIGRIIGMASIATPISPGQFGTFDLMIFTEEGNYAATVTDEGKYSTIGVMQRDVCVNPKTITTTDYTLVYVSGKGVMSADGNSITCISEALDGVPDEYFGVSDVEPQSFLPESLIAYDYAGNRLIFGSPTGKKAYIRNRDGLWSTANWGPFTSVLNIYPYSYIQQGERILKLDKSYPYDDSKEYDAYLVTRPLKLDSLQQKKLHRLSVEGSLLTKKEILLWGSNDGEKWIYLGGSSAREIVRITGRSFKYWRVALEATLTGCQNISGFRIRLEDRKERRFR